MLLKQSFVLQLASFIVVGLAIGDLDSSQGTKNAVQRHTQMQPRDVAKLSPKLLVLNLFTPEEQAFTSQKSLDLLAQNITIPGLSPRYSQAHCSTDGSVCQVTLGEGEINAASSMSALIYSNVFNLTTTYFLIAGIAGVNPYAATIGSVMFARYQVQVTLQYEFDIRDIGENFTTGYIPFGATSTNGYPTSFYGTEVFELNDELRQQISQAGVPKNHRFNDTAAAQRYRSQYPQATANGGPDIVLCDGATSDNFYHGRTLSNAFGNFTKLITNGTAQYCSTSSEDSAILEVLLRGAKAKLVDFARIIDMRAASNFDQPPPGTNAYQELIFQQSPGFGVALVNLGMVGANIIGEIVTFWTTKYQRATGVGAKNYIGDVFATLGGTPDFGPYP